MRSFKMSLFILLLSAALFSCGNKGFEIYVSPYGDDGANGEFSVPIESLQRAAELARTRAGEVPVTVFLSGGNYRLTEPLELSIHDGGTAEAPVHWKAVPGENPVISGGIPVGKWKQEEDELPEVHDVEKLELVLLHDWSITRIGVKSINRKKNHLIAADTIGARLPFFTLTHWEEQPRYYLENAREFCDSPGEWYCDFEARTIYYRPLANEKISETEGVIPVAPKLLAEKCGFFDCTIRHAGGSGIWIRHNCSECIISESHIYDISGNGVNIGEGRDRLVNGIPWWKATPEQVSKNNEISHSLIEDCGKQFYGAVGIWGGLVSNTLIDHNEIRSLPYTGVSVGWMWNPQPTPCRENIIHANHIHHIMKILSDGGGIYCLGLQPNSRITDNLIHDVTINTGRAESNGMFLDEGITDLLVENNIVYNIARSPLRFHKAFHIVVRNNILVCGDEIPPIRYNNTKEEDIIKVDNLVLSQSSKTDMEKLKAIVEKRMTDFGSKTTNQE